jgi:putative redox protein
MSDNWREVIAEWEGEMAFKGCNPRGGTVQIGTLNEQPGIGPMELLLLGVAGCTGMDIVSILQKKREPLKDLKVKVRGKRAETYPQVFTEIEVVYFLWGDDLSTRAVEQAIQLSEEKYCSASAMLRSSAKFQSSYQILSDGETVDLAFDV